MRPRPTTDDRVLIVTGGYLAGTRGSLATAAWKQLLQLRHARQSWLEAKVKLTVAEPVLTARLHARRHRARWTPALYALMDAHDDLATPELTAVVLATALAAAGTLFECLTIDQLLRGDRASEAKLRDCNMVFASATFLRDLSELEPLVARLKRPWNRIVVGGALAGTLHAHWNGDPAVDVLAIGYGERLVPALAAWMRSGFRELSAPAGGRIEQKAHTALHQVPHQVRRAHGRRLGVLHTNVRRRVHHVSRLAVHDAARSADRLLPRAAAPQGAVQWICYARGRTAGAPD